MLGLLCDKLVSATLLVLNLLAPVEVHVDTNRAYAAGTGHQADVYRPTGPGPSPVLVFLYGGGWRNGSKEDVAYVGAALARKGFVVVIPEYRHFPPRASPTSSPTTPPRSPGRSATHPSSAAIPAGSSWRVTPPAPGRRRCWGSTRGG